MLSGSPDSSGPDSLYLLMLSSLFIPEKAGTIRFSR